MSAIIRLEKITLPTGTGLLDLFYDNVADPTLPQQGAMTLWAGIPYGGANPANHALSDFALLSQSSDTAGSVMAFDENGLASTDSYTYRLAYGGYDVPSRTTAGRAISGSYVYGGKTPTYGQFDVSSASAYATHLDLGILSGFAGCAGGTGFISATLDGSVAFTLGFQPDVIICLLPITNGSYYHVNRGYYVGGIGQCCAVIADADGVATGCAPVAYVSDQYAGVVLNPSTGAVSYGVELAATATGFTATSRIAAPGSTRYIHYLALKLPAGQAAWCGVVDSPTSTGSDWAVTSPGFKPGYVELLPNMCSSVNSGVSGADAGTFNVAGVDVFGHTFCNGVSVEDGSDPSDTQSYRSDLFVDYYIDDGSSKGHVFDAVSRTSTGWTVSSADLATVDGTARKWPALAIQESPWVSKPGVAIKGTVGVALGASMDLYGVARKATLYAVLTPAEGASYSPRPSILNS